MRGGGGESAGCGGGAGAAPAGQGAQDGSSSRGRGVDAGPACPVEGPGGGGGGRKGGGRGPAGLAQLRRRAGEEPGPTRASYSRGAPLRGARAGPAGHSPAPMGARGDPSPAPGPPRPPSRRVGAELAGEVVVVVGKPVQAGRSQRPGARLHGSPLGPTQISLIKIARRTCVDAGSAPGPTTTTITRVILRVWGGSGEVRLQPSLHTGRSRWDFSPSPNHAHQRPCARARPLPAPRTPGGRRSLSEGKGPRAPRSAINHAPPPTCLPRPRAPRAGRAVRPTAPRAPCPATGQGTFPTIVGSARSEEGTRALLLGAPAHLSPGASAAAVAVRGALRAGAHRSGGTLEPEACPGRRRSRGAEEPAASGRRTGLEARKSDAVPSCVPLGTPCLSRTPPQGCLPEDSQQPAHFRGPCKVGGQDWRAELSRGVGDPATESHPRLPLRPLPYLVKSVLCLR
ncbi:collagen alpha-1(I) chain-like [Suncus etruscus]|uniref:collagen alpha-1(I) chain-like n=1 Tax=Suncus etruscus TaxID=109475 RepID=UPI00211071E8|nr:collagen alpha-1(I) chain-like [Suncus etruscus]